MFLNRHSIYLKNSICSTNILNCMLKVFVKKRGTVQWNIGIESSFYMNISIYWLHQCYSLNFLAEKISFLIHISKYILQREGAGIYGEREAGGTFHHVLLHNKRPPK